VGVGCSTGAPAAEVEALLLRALEEAGVSPLSLAALATIDRRADEPAIRRIAQRSGCPMHTFSAEQLAVVNVPTPSAVVESAVGTASVCEAAALLASGAEGLILNKRKSATATVAIARMRERQ
jgi:cobalt-precorrin 5A hydrolase/precorrin-3B C17-methyltransferase